MQYIMILSSDSKLQIELNMNYTKYKSRVSVVLNLCIKPYMLFRIVVSKLQILCSAYIALALLLLGRPKIFLYALLNATQIFRNVDFL